MQKYVTDVNTGERVLIHVGCSGSGSKSCSIAPFMKENKRKVLYLEQPKPDSVELAAMIIVHTRYKNV